MCWHSGEDVDHLLIHCEGAYWLWSYAFRSFGLSWVLPKRVVDVLAGWSNWLGKRSSGIWNLVPSCVMWIACRERYNRIFEDLERPGEQHIEFFAGTLFDWSHAWRLTSSDSIPLFIDSLFLCIYFLGCFIFFQMKQYFPLIKFFL